ncbi:MAG: orotidine-5'-phosphate decarboxylase [Planctomycetes bacterium]|nr:orotidine-5'-phosphate decarboxylase [Planctomycetota bacterium]
MMAKQNFADRVIARTLELASPIAAGIDPRPDLLSSRAAAAAGGSHVRLARAYERFALDVLDGLVGVVPAVKVQIAFYEALGLPGVAAYARTLRAAKERGFLVIGDVKRGDIGPSSQAYADAHFGAAAGADADALTVSPYLGRDTIAPFLVRCREEGRGLFALVRTSNPSAPEVQDLVAGGRPIYEHVAGLVEEWGRDLRGAEGYSSLGAVVGATYPEELAAIRSRHPRLLILVPGYGAQGGTAMDVVAALDARAAGILVASSRGILRAYRAAEDRGASGRDAVHAAALEMRDQIRAAWDARRRAEGGPREA